MLIYDLPVGLATARLVADSFKGSLMTTMFRRFVVLAVVVIAAIATPALAQPAGAWCQPVATTSTCGHCLVGRSLNFDVPVSVSTFKSEEFGFAATFGGSYTLVLNDVFSFRVIQPDVLISTAGSTRTNFRLSTGIVFRYQ